VWFGIRFGREQGADGFSYWGYGAVQSNMLRLRTRQKVQAQYCDPANRETAKKPMTNRLSGETGLQEVGVGSTVWKKRRNPIWKKVVIGL